MKCNKLLFLCISSIFTLTLGFAKFDEISENESLLSLLSQQLPFSSDNITEDALLDTIGLATKYGYPSEIHEVQTEDGYILTMHRITSGKTENKADKRIPVFVMHGLLCSSADWVVNGPGSGLAYILADEGYDVWLGNARGNFYSKKHVSLSTKSRKFWRFSWHEIGIYDLPASIDYVLKHTEHKKLHYIGHSQGTTSFFVMGSEKPEYNSKILSMQALAPAAYFTHSRSPLFKLLNSFEDALQILLTIIGKNEVLPHTNITIYLANNYCNEASKYQPICTAILYNIAGHNPDQLNLTMLPIYMSHTPAGASSRQIIHYAQIYKSGIFRNYDYGFIGNMIKYNSIAPPKYNLKRVKAPVALHYGENDLLLEPIDVFKVNYQLPNPIGLFRVPHKKFNHLDFLWAIDVKSLLYDTVISLMRKFE